MSTLIFDIETVGESFEDLDNVTQNILLRYAKRSARNEVEQLLLERDVKESLGFSPLTGSIVALGLYDLERKQGVVYYTGLPADTKDIIDGEFTFKVRSEKSLLAEFWEGAEHYDTFVTFNGRQFDAPFLVHRSVVYELKPSKNLLEGRFPYQQKSTRHIDLQDELTFFGAMNRRPSLHLFCRAYGITSPKTEVGGDDVQGLYQTGEFLKIARYNADDVIATTKLYKRWLTISPYGQNELENIDF